MTNFLSLVWARYLALLKEKPVATKAITSGTLAGLSDILAQKISGSKSIELRRAILMAIYGLLYVGPSAHFVHRLLDKIFASKQDMATAVKKVLVEQLSYGPLCNIVAMTYISRIVEGRPFRQTVTRVMRRYPEVQLNGWRVWPLVALINYKFVPFQLRVLFVNFIAIFWSTFLILKSRAGIKKKQIEIGKTA